MKSIKYGIMLLAAFASFSSCDEHDFLKEEPLDFYIQCQRYFKPFNKCQPGK